MKQVPEEKPRPAATVEAEESTARRKAQARLRWKKGPPPSGMMWLQASSVKERARGTYEQERVKVKGAGVEMGEAPLPEREWNLILSLYLDQLYVEEEPANAGEKVLAAVMWRTPSLARDGGARMSRTCQSFRGWRRLCPAAGRPPLPHGVVCAIVMWMLQQKRVDLVSREFNPRPGEALSPQAQEVVPMRDEAQAGKLSTRLHPFVRQLPSKNRKFDRTLALSPRRDAALSWRLKRWLPPLKPTDRVLNLTMAMMNRELKRVSTALHLTVRGTIHAYRLRHTGASRDFITNNCDISGIQLCGRWRGPRSRRRYQQLARMGELVQRAPVQVQRHAAACRACRPSALYERRVPLTAAGPRRSWSSSACGHRLGRCCGAGPPRRGTFGSAARTTCATRRRRPDCSAGQGRASCALGTRRRPAARGSDLSTGTPKCAAGPTWFSHSSWRNSCAPASRATCHGL